MPAIAFTAGRLIRAPRMPIGLLTHSLKIGFQEKPAFLSLRRICGAADLSVITAVMNILGLSSGVYGLFQELVVLCR